MLNGVRILAVILVAAAACSQAPPSTDAGPSDKDAAEEDATENDDVIADSAATSDASGAVWDVMSNLDVSTGSMDVPPVDTTAQDSAANKDVPPQVVPYNPPWSTKTEFSQIPPVTVKIPKGDFWMGCTTHDPFCDIGKYPQVKVTVSTFEMAKYETTVAQYHACVHKGPCTPRHKANSCESVGVGPPWIGELNYSNEIARRHHPEHCVSWKQARTFCKWLGKGWDLPTEVQWARAARGGCEFHKGKDCKTQMPTYPFGELPKETDKYCDYMVIESQYGGSQRPSGPTNSGCGTGSSMPVGSKPKGISPWGVHNLAGNVAERLLDDWIAPRDSKKHAVGKAYAGVWPPAGSTHVDSIGVGPSAPKLKVGRGGSYMARWDQAKGSASTMSRGESAIAGNKTLIYYPGYPALGFRCAKSGK